MIHVNAGAFLQIVAVVVGIVVGLGGLSATIWAIGKVRGVEASIDMLNSANHGLREANEDLRHEMIRSERDCAERISKLEGQNQSLLDGVGDSIARSIAIHLESMLQTIGDRIVEAVEHRIADHPTR